LRIVRAQQAPIKDAALTLDLEANPEIGERSPPTVMVEFPNSQCGYCRRHLTDTIPRVMRELTDTGKVQGCAGNSSEAHRWRAALRNLRVGFQQPSESDPMING
jgi:hypothetical protein